MIVLQFLIISLVNSSVVEEPPISFVLTFFSFNVILKPSVIKSANLGKLRYLNIMIELKSKALGFAIFFPAISFPVCRHPLIYK